MTAWLWLIPAVVTGYLAAVAAYCWFRRGKDRLDGVLDSEQRPQSDALLASLTRMNPGYRFRRHSNDEQLVTRPAPAARSIVGDQAR